MDSINKLLGMLGGIKGGDLILIILFVGALCGFALLYFWLKRKDANQPRDILHRKTTKQPLVCHEGSNKAECILGTGSYKCAALRDTEDWGQILHYTTIPKPIGRLSFNSVTCPVSGAIYYVQELSNGEIVPWDPRDVPLISEDTPRRAYLATHIGEFMKKVYLVPTSWYQSMNNWFAIGAILATFIIVLAATGG